ncbi:MAG: AI-2E family transporter [Mesorhizobium sp.]|uniref:AI-2E family transporter n=1 Tax=Mesorhizobium sp. TaxID=1871066 RepID=UPI000FE316AD|nr:AI-2E family transporter [Mesorhizobium sp.]RWJ04891.1 MAG: AI-2E family transporter [Mesorhizobium sp.]RWJ11947.1 MAG: AI-2E family transporter [Mesorhizobium sp.]
MSNRSAKKLPIVRLPPKSNAEILLARTAQLSIALLGVIGGIFALKAGEYILAPIGTGVVVGLMLGPLASWLEGRRISRALSAAIVVTLFAVAACILAVAMAAPLSIWIGRLPQVWNELRVQLTELRGPLEAIGSMRGQIREITGTAGLKVSIEDGSPIESVATLAPAVIGQILLFFASLYFFVATRYDIRTALLKLCFDRRLRWRVAHIFRDVEDMVSTYLLSITAINVGFGLVVGAALFAIGVPSALLWGGLAGLLNFVPYIGPAVTAVILFAVGLAEFDTLGGSLLPPAIYLGLNFIEGQFVTPIVIGRTMTLNPFVVLLALVFWIWLWGAIGGFIAIPALLAAYGIIHNILPGADWSGEYLNGRRR